MKEKHTDEGARSVPIVSRVLPDGRLVELVYEPTEPRTRFVVGNGDTITIEDSIRVSEKETLVPIPPTSNLIQHGAVLLPGCPEPYQDTAALLAEIGAYIDKYLDLSSTFRQIACAYVLLSWVYDAFNEVPYLVVRGDLGSGKTRALTILGSIAYKGFFASGASTVSPIFYTLDNFRGTLVLDEADFRFSDERAEIIKILNSGSARGFPVLRQSVSRSKDFDPRAFSVFGPKIIAMRHAFDDAALESRCIIEAMGQRPLRPGIPINLPDSWKQEACAIRNKLLTYRFRTYGTLSTDQSLASDTRLARTNQMLLPLLAVIQDEQIRRDIEAFVEQSEREQKADRALAPEGMILTVLAQLYATHARSTISMAMIADRVIARFGRDFDRPVTPRYVGELIRKRLHLKTYKTGGVYVLAITERKKVEHLAMRYGITDELKQA